MKMRIDRTFVVAVVLAASCEDNIDLDPLDATPPIEASVRPRSISGGTLTIVSGQAVAADPDRDLVHVVDVGTGALRHTIALAPGDEPGRVVAGASGIAHVVLRGSGRVATIDLSAGSVGTSERLCADPRGLAFDAGDATLHVACADGQLVQLASATGIELDRKQLEPDLRDVVLYHGTLYVSRFRSAELISVDGAARLTPGDVDQSSSRVAWRTFVDPSSDTIMMLHQIESTEEVPIEPTVEELEGGSDLPYGGGSGCTPGLVVPALSMLQEDDLHISTFVNARLTVDAAVSPTDQLVALAMPGVEPDRPSVALTFAGESDCFPEGDSAGADAGEQPQPLAQLPPKQLGQITSVAFTEDGALVMQSREPAQLVIQRRPPNGGIERVALQGESRFDSGHEIFHRTTDSGLSCASCHPEGSDDGHVWRFTDLGQRRTQSLDIDLAGTAPFHWDGDMKDLDVLMSEVLAHRMGGKRQSRARAESFATWLFEQRRPAIGAGGEDASQIAQGEVLFTAYACNRCHTGAELGGITTEAFRDAKLQVPSLHRVALRPPFMHDGRSATLEDAVVEMLEGTGIASAPAQDIDALVAYLRTR